MSMGDEFYSLVYLVVSACVEHPACPLDTDFLDALQTEENQ